MGRRLPARTRASWCRSRNVGTQPIQGQATITPTQFGDLAADLWYVNLHTAQAPGGEIRGQLRRRQ